MDEDAHNGAHGERDRDATYSATEAGRVLGVSSERVRQLIDSGDLEGEKRRGRWFVFRWSVHDALQQRGSPRSRRSPQTGEDASHEVAELHRRIEDLQYKLGRTEAHVELTAEAESTIREQLLREQERADRLEEETRQLRERLEEARTPRRGFFARIFGGE